MSPGPRTGHRWRPGRTIRHFERICPPLPDRPAGRLPLDRRSLPGTTKKFRAYTRCYHSNRGSRIEQPFETAPAALGRRPAGRPPRRHPAGGGGHFQDRGFADTGMRDIADAAGLSPANLYHYFQGKDEISFIVRTARSIACSRHRARGGVAGRCRIGPAPCWCRTCACCSTRSKRHAHLQTESLAALRAHRPQARCVRAGLRGSSRGCRRSSASPNPAWPRAHARRLSWTVTWFDPRAR